MDEHNQTPSEAEAASARQLTQIERLIDTTPAPSEELRRIAACVRRLARHAITAPDDAEALRPLAEGLESLVEDLPGEKREDGSPRPSRFYEDMDPADYSANPRGTHPLMGRTNPVAPPLEVRVEENRMVAEVTYDTFYEGNLGWVQGGFIAAAFDVMVVTAARLSGRTGPTGTLEVRYRKPTLIHDPMRYESWFESREGRKIFVRGQLVRQEDASVCAEVRGIVVTQA